MDKSCVNCICWFPYDQGIRDASKELAGECRLKPPVLVMTNLPDDEEEEGLPSWDWLYPVTMQSSWCVDGYRAKEPHQDPQ